MYTELTQLKQISLRVPEAEKESLTSATAFKRNQHNSNNTPISSKS